MQMSLVCSLVLLRAAPAHMSRTWPRGSNFCPGDDVLVRICAYVEFMAAGPNIRNIAEDDIADIGRSPVIPVYGVGKDVDVGADPKVPEAVLGGEDRLLPAREEHVCNVCVYVHVCIVYTLLVYRYSHCLDCVTDPHPKLHRYDTSRAYLCYSVSDTRLM